VFFLHLYYALNHMTLSFLRAWIVSSPPLSRPPLWAVLGSELRVSCLLGRYTITWVTPPALFCVEYFRDRVSRTICLSWPQTAIFLISASWVARIIGVRHWHLAQLPFIWAKAQMMASELTDFTPLLIQLLIPLQATASVQTHTSCSSNAK
jgi:hypothetical protein